MNNRLFWISIIILWLANLHDIEAQNTIPYIYICKGMSYEKFEITNGREMLLSDDRTQLTIGTAVFDVADIDSICFELPQFPQEADTTVIVTTGDTVYINYEGDSVTVSVPEQYIDSISSVVIGAHVALTSTIRGTDVVYCLSGTTTNGSFYVKGTYKLTLVLNGVNIISNEGAAIDIDCGKRIAIELAEGTDNYLTDKKGGDQKACLYTKGHAEFSKGGKLTVKGQGKHAIASKEYCLIKKTTGTIDIDGAASDGIHAGQYFKLNGGNINITDTQGDAIEAETTNDATDLQNGQMIIDGGALSITVGSKAAKALKCDSLFALTDGTITITQTGDKEVKGSDASYPTAIKTSGDILISGGTLTIDNTADGGKGISADGNISITGGTINVTANGTGGTYVPTEEEEEEEPDEPEEPQPSYKVYVNVPTTTGGNGQVYWTSVTLYSSTGTMVGTLTKKVTVSSPSGGSPLTFHVYDFGEPTQGTYYFRGPDYVSRGNTNTIRSASFKLDLQGEDVYYRMATSPTTSGNTRTFSLTNVTSTYSGGEESAGGGDGSIVYAAACIKSDGDMTIDGGNLTLIHKGAMSKGIKCDKTFTLNGGELTFTTGGASKVYNNDATYCTAIKTNDYVQTDGRVKITASGTASRGISASKNMTIDGGENTITCSGDGATMTGGTYAARGYRCEGNLAINGGKHTITCTGKGGKGIKVDGNATFGTEKNGGPVMTVKTSGAAISSSGGGFGGSVSGSAKAIKVTGPIVINDGDYTITTTTNGAEGIESKQTITVNGGDIYINAYDDCMNTKGKTTFNGGRTYCWSSNNDAVDSNANSAGAITITGGVVIAISKPGSPEEGLDCDNNSYIRVTGGYIFSGGGSQGGGGGGWGGGGGSGNTISGATQGYYFLTSSVNYATGRYYTIADNAGNNIFTFKPQAAFTSTLSLISSPDMKKGTTYTIKYGTTAPTDAKSEYQGFYFGSTASGTSQSASFTAQ